LVKRRKKITSSKLSFEKKIRDLEKRKDFLGIPTKKMRDLEKRIEDLEEELFDE